MQCRAAAAACHHQPPLSVRQTHQLKLELELKHTVSSAPSTIAFVVWSRPDQTNGRTHGLVGATQRSDHLAAKSEPSIGLLSLSVRAYSRPNRRTHTPTGRHLGALGGRQSRRQTHRRRRAEGRARSTSSSSRLLRIHFSRVSWVCKGTVSLPPRAHTHKVTQSDDANNAAPQEILPLARCGSLLVLLQSGR